MKKKCIIEKWDRHFWLGFQPACDAVIGDTKKMGSKRWWLMLASFLSLLILKRILFFALHSSQLFCYTISGIILINVLMWLSFMWHCFYISVTLSWWPVYPLLGWLEGPFPSRATRWEDLNDDAITLRDKERALCNHTRPAFLGEPH